LNDADPSLVSRIIDAYEYEIFAGYPDDTFKPNQLINTDELMAIIVRTLTTAELPEPDNDRSRNYRSWIDEMSIIGTLSVSSRDAVAILLYDVYRMNDYVREEGVGYVIEE
jgi:hypothetical protein